jgi:hypothetical protein
MAEHRMTTVESICTFAFAGNATLTLRSKKTGARFTYRLREKDGGKVTFVALLNGPDNETAYQYLGHYRGPDYSHGRKSKISKDAASAQAFQFFAQCLAENHLPESLEVYHEGRCGACGRKLTVPESILTGLGPECSERAGVTRVKCDEPDAFGLKEVA